MKCCIRDVTNTASTVWENTKRAETSAKYPLRKVVGYPLSYTFPSTQLKLHNVIVNTLFLLKRRLSSPSIHCWVDNYRIMLQSAADKFQKQNPKSVVTMGQYFQAIDVVFVQMKVKRETICSLSVRLPTVTFWFHAIFSSFRRHQKFVFWVFGIWRHPKRFFATKQQRLTRSQALQNNPEKKHNKFGTFMKCQVYN